MMGKDAFGSYGGSLAFEALEQWETLKQAADRAGLLGSVVLDSGDKRLAIVRLMRDLFPASSPGSFEMFDSLFVRRLEKLAQLMGERLGQPDVEGDREQFVFCQDGDVWLIRFAAESGTYAVPGNKGLKHLADILSRPYRRLKGAELQGLPGNAVQPEHSFQVVLEGEALAKFQEEAREYARLIDQARRNNDPAAEERWENERRELFDRMQTSLGRGGTARRLGPADLETKAFEAVHKAIKRSLKKLQEKLPSLVSHLAATLQVDHPTFSYIPDYDPLHPSPDWRF
jgi:hypothetical protein